MEKEDLFDHSPVRTFDKVTDGGLKQGEIGLVTSKKGLGKTSVLVQFGMDALLQNKQLVHVSFDQHSANVISWYESIFNEIAKKKNFSNIGDIKDDLVRERTILNFSQENFSLAKVIKTLRALKEGGIKVAAIVIDGVDLSKVSADDMKVVAQFVKDENLTAWLSTTATGETLSDSVPAQLQNYFEIVLHLTPKTDGVYVAVVKCHDKPASPAVLRLDQKSLLMMQK
jgi:KaiC/GvpD/RAD55 family RecA-like ATPase